MIGFNPQTPILNLVQRGVIRGAISDTLTSFSLKAREKALHTQREAKKEIEAVEEEEQLKPYTSPSSEISRHKARLMKHGSVEL